MRLGGKIAIVTGAGSGIGRAASLLFAREGCALLLVDRDREAVLDSAREAAELGAKVGTEVGDVGEPACGEAAVAAAERMFGRLDILTTAAGFSTGGTVLTTDPADWDAVFRAHVGGTWLFARAAIPAMRRAGGGAIVTVASQLALAGGRGNSAYVAAKGAILSLTRTMALDFADDGIRVNAVAPGAIQTPLLDRAFARHTDPVAARERSRLRHPAGRFGRPEEVAEAILYLASDASSFTTGITLPVDGGWLAA